jgi:peptidoglycan hydrolase CwlO-like protein
MKKSNLELIILLLGVLALGFSLFLMFSDIMDGVSSMFWTNIIIAVGFVVYILYNWSATNALHKEIKGLNQHVIGLKGQIQKLNEELEEQKKKNSILVDEKAGLTKQLEGAQETIATQQKEIDLLKSKLPEENQTTGDT